MMAIPKTPTAKMKAAIKEIVVPCLQGKGFGGLFPNFRRLTPSYIHIMMFNFPTPKNSNAFCVELCVGSAGALNTYFLSRGLNIDQITFGDFKYTARLTPQDPPSDHWWAYKRTSGVQDVGRFTFMGESENSFNALATNLRDVMEQRLDVQLALLESQVKY